MIRPSLTFSGYANTNSSKRPHIFISAGEPSGDLHGSNLIHSFRKLNQEIAISGLGGEKMTQAGANIIYPLTELAVMWFGRTLANLDKFFKLARQTEAYFRRERPDALVVIDYPGFHWALAKRAYRTGIPTFYFVPPQLWAWGGWRTKKMSRWFDTVLTALPFEDEWYRTKGIRTHYVGHPYFDELHEQKIDREFIASLKQPGGKLVALLPGSRNQEVAANFPLMLTTQTKHTQHRVPNARFAVASFNQRQAKSAGELAAGCGLPLEIHVQRTPEIIEAADACVAVSGSVGFELMYRLKPTVVVYKIAPFARFVSRQFITCKYISLVNLTAGEELFPEFLTTEDCSSEASRHVIQWLTNPTSMDQVVTKLKALREKTAIPGACDRAAAFILAKINANRGI